MPAETEAKSTRARNLWPSASPEFLTLPLPSRLLVPLSVKSHGDAKPKPPGTKVRPGEPLAEGPAESSHIPLAPAAGTIGNARPIRLTTGHPATGVEFTPSAEVENPVEPAPVQSDDPFSLIDGLERLRAAGVWADRHVSPDLIGQLNQIISRPIDTIICTILDSDASLRLNAAVAARWPKKIVAGLSFLAEITGARRTIIAVESQTSPLWLSPLENAAMRSNFEIVDLPNDYPQSDPVLMIFTLTNRRVRPGNLPTQHGALVLDAAAAMAVGDAVESRPMLTVPVAVHEHAARRSHFYLVPVGATLDVILKQLWLEPYDIFLRGGDLLRDHRLRPDAVIAGGELTIHITARERSVIPEPCIRCAWCIEACPTRIHPASILDAAQRADSKMAARAGIAACIECGICEHVCPSRLPLLSAIRDMRKL